MENFGFLPVLHYLCSRKLTGMKQITLIIACVWMTLATYAQRTIVVEKGNVQSLLAAINEANRQNADSTAERLFILIPNGLYDLGDRVLTKISGHHIALIGQDMNSTIIRNCPDSKNEGISKTAVLLNMGTDNYLQDLTLQNALDYYSCASHGRAVTLQDKGTRTICNRVRLLSHQDTYYSWAEDARHYFQDSEIHGTVDFICGAGDVWFERCRLVTEKRTTDGSGRNVIAAPRTSETPWGFVFNHCTIENIITNFEYARGWHTHPRCTWLYTTLLTPEKLNATRFDRYGLRSVENNFKEYGTMDAKGRNITPASNVVTFEVKEEKNAVETILTAEDAQQFTLDNTFPDWKPVKVIEETEKNAKKLLKRL